MSARAIYRRTRNTWPNRRNISALVRAGAHIFMCCTQTHVRRRGKKRSRANGKHLACCESAARMQQTQRRPGFVAPLSLQQLKFDFNRSFSRLQTMVLSCQINISLGSVSLRPIIVVNIHASAFMAKSISAGCDEGRNVASSHSSSDTSV